MPPFLGAQPREQRIATASLPPFDPEELTRRLYLVQAEQKAYVERKRRAKIEVKRQAKVASVGESSERIAKSTKPPSHPSVTETRDNDDRAANGKSPDRSDSLYRLSSEQSHQFDGTVASTKAGAKLGRDRPSSSYHHTPRVAASQFARTTTADNPVEAHVHSLSKKALKFHVDGPNADQDLRAAESNLGPRGAARTLRRVQSQREGQYERNQFQHPAQMDSVTEIDDERLRLAQRHTFETTFGKDEQNRETDQAPKRSSVGANHFAPVFAELAVNALHLDRTDSRDLGSIGALAPESRVVDWTQSDESPKSPGNVAPSLLRKVDSKWNLTGRFAKSQKASKPQTLSSPTEESATDDSPISPKSPRPGLSCFLALLLKPCS